jgi:hypothetical protein
VSSPQNDAIKQEILQKLTHPVQVLKHLNLLGGALVQPGGRGRTILCPWHNEREPSCSVTVGRGGTLRAYCFSCGAVGDVFALLAVVHGLTLPGDFVEVLGMAADLAGVTIPERAPKALPMPPARLLPEAPVQAVATPEQDKAISRAITLLCETCPVDSDGGIAEGLAGRMLLDEARRAGWGVLPKADAHRLLRRPEYEVLAPMFFREGRLRFADNRLIIPWCRPDGRPWSFQRRFAPRTGLEDPKKLGLAKIPKYIWPPSEAYVPRERWPFGVEHYAVTDPDVQEIWTVEGAPDTMSVRLLNELGALAKDGSARKLGVLGLPGTATLGQYLATLATFVAGKRVVIGVDSDAAGKKVAPVWAEAMMTAGATATRIATPRDHDWNLLLRSLR